MSPPSAHKLRSVLSQSGWEKAAEILQRLDPAVAADALLDVPFDEQRELYRRLPIPFAALCHLKPDALMAELRARTYGLAHEGRAV